MTFDDGTEMTELDLLHQENFRLQDQVRDLKRALRIALGFEDTFTMAPDVASRTTGAFAAFMATPEDVTRLESEVAWLSHTAA